MPDDYSMYPASYRGKQRYRDRYDKFTPQQQNEAWAQSGELPPVSPESVYAQPMSTVGAGAPPAAMSQQFQTPANPYSPMSPEHRAFREMEASGDAVGIQRLLQQSIPQATGLFGY